MEGKDTEQVSTDSDRRDDRNELDDGTPIPDPEEDRGDAEDVPSAD
jgi:hypothetical protein